MIPNEVLETIKNKVRFKDFNYTQSNDLDYHRNRAIEAIKKYKEYKKERAEIENYYKVLEKWLNENEMVVAE